MAISIGTLNTRLGNLVKVLNETNSTNSAQQASLLAALRQYAQSLVVQMVAADQQLPNLSFGTAYTELLRQMAVANAGGQAYYEANHVNTAQTTATATGNPTLRFTDIDQYGFRSDFLIPDVFQLRATTTTSLTIRGTASVQTTTFNWPQGTGVDTVVTLVDSNVASNLLDPSLNNWTTTGTPSLINWTTSGGTITKNVTDGYAGSTVCANLTSDGSTTIRLYQTASNLTSGGYAVHVAVKKITAGATGVLTLALRDVSGTLLGTAGLSQGVNVADVGTLTTNTWEARSGTVFIPPLLSNGAYFELRWSGGSAADVIRVDSVAITPFTPLYVNGLKFVGFRGTIDLVPLTDQWVYTSTVDTAGGSASPVTLSIVKGLDRLINISGQIQRLPTSTTPSTGYTDALIA